MHKFKIGDKVKVVDEQKMLDFHVPAYAKRHGTIKELSTRNSEKPSEKPAVQFEGDSWWYPETCLDYDWKFNPKPGDTIVCNNGMTFTACKVEDYQYFDYYPDSKIATESKDASCMHMCWSNFDGVAEYCHDYNIKEIIPASVPALIPEPKTYTVREVFNAIKGAYDMSRATDAEVAVVQKILDRRDDPDYTTYLDLKKRFETKD